VNGEAAKQLHMAARVINGPLSMPAHIEHAEHRLVIVDRDRRVGHLVRIDTNRRDHHQPPQ
jgi:hypothetical protein